MTAWELISGAKNQREVDLIDRLIEAYETIPVYETIGRRAYDLLKMYAKSGGLRTFDSLIAATAIEKREHSLAGIASTSAWSTDWPWKFLSTRKPSWAAAR